MENTYTLLADKISRLNEIEALSFLAAEFPAEVVLSSSFSWEDQAISHMILTNKLPIEIFTLDTGRLFSETYYVWTRTNEIYNTKIRGYYPNQDSIANYADKYGPNAFYESVELRKSCCYIRKVEPLKRALEGKKIWITGLRSAHSAQRHDLPQLEWDETHQLFKYHPILNWDTDFLKKYIADNNVPYNPLHDKGFVSIGCAPCTRAIKEGEDFRAGRWWWEDNSKKECGLHVH